MILSSQQTATEENIRPSSLPHSGFNVHAKTDDEGDADMFDAVTLRCPRAPKLPTDATRPRRKVKFIPKRDVSVVMDVYKDVPKYDWDRNQQKFVLSHRSPRLWPDVRCLVNRAAERFLPVLQRVKVVSFVHWWDTRIDPSLNVLAQNDESPVPRQKRRSASSSSSSDTLKSSNCHQLTAAVAVNSSINSNAFDVDENSNEPFNNSLRTNNRATDGANNHSTGESAEVPRRKVKEDVVNCDKLSNRKQLILWPVECAVGRYVRLNLIGVLKKRQRDVEDEDGYKGAAAMTAASLQSPLNIEWTLSDLQQTVKLRISKHTKFEDSFFVDGSVVVVKGHMSAVDEIFIAEKIHQPPREVNDDFIFPVDMFGGGISQEAKLQRVEVHRREIEMGVGKEAPSEVFIVFSEVHLNNLLILDRLRCELTVIDTVVGQWRAPQPTDSPQQHCHPANAAHCSTTIDHTIYNTEPQPDSSLGINDTYAGESVDAAMPRLVASATVSLQLPVGIVFMGSFQSMPAGSRFTFSCGERYIRGFTALTEILLDMPNILKYCELIFVPGPQDPSPNILPQPPIAELFTNNLAQTVKRLHADASITFTSNPCRIRYKSREMVFFRHNLVSALAAEQSVLHNPFRQKYSPTEEELANYIPNLLSSQGHLLPIAATQNAQMAVTWGFDHTLRIDPLPDLICISDDCPPYVCRTSDSAKTIFFNPGQCVTDKAMCDITAHNVSIMETDREGQNL